VNRAISSISADSACDVPPAAGDRGRCRSERRLDGVPPTDPGALSASHRHPQPAFLGSAL